MNFFEGFVYFFTRMGKIFTKYNGFFGEGVRNTLIIAFFTVLFGALLGTLLAVMKMGRFKPTRWFANAYIEFIRGTPLMIQLMFLFYGLPMLGISFPEVSFIPNFDRFAAGVFAMSINSAAYVAEIVRSGIQAVDSCLRDKILSGKAVGPRILAGNMAVSVPGGHMAGSLAYEATSPEEAAALVRKIAEDKPDLIKLMITGGVLDAKSKGEPGELKMPPEVVKAACDQAHALGLPVAAHVESPQGVRVALEGGVDTIEHGAKPDEEILRLFKERHACHIATISPALPYAMFDRSVTGASETEQYNGRIVMDGIIDCAKACLKNGIPVGLGTDTGCPYITHYDMWREVYYFHKLCNVSNAFALHTATLGNARLVGLGEEIGSIEPGKCADLIVTRANPLEDLKALRHIDLVMARGNLYRSPKVKKMEKAERELDKFL